MRSPARIAFARVLAITLPVAALASIVPALVADEPDPTDGAAAARPNVLLFLVDDMGWQDTSEPFLLDADGSPIVTPLNRRYRTPAMERLADRGMKFTNAYAMPVCTPTRVSIMTGLNAARHHVTTWTHPKGAETGDNDVAHLRSPRDWRRTGADASDITLPRLLRDAGYRTIHVGKAHFGSSPGFGSDPRNLGFEINVAGSEIGHPGSYFGTDDFGRKSNRPVPDLEKYHGEEIFLTEALTLEMAAAIKASTEAGKPFFASMAHYAVHGPFMTDPRFAANYPELAGPELAYATLIEGMDKSLGDLLAHLDTLGIAEETLVIFLSDNGGDAPIPNDRKAPVVSGCAPLRGKKGMRYEGGIRVPMIAAWAKPEPSHPMQSRLAIPSGSVCTDIVTVFDLFPTILGLAGVEAPQDRPIDGHDLAPYLRGEPGHHRPQELVIHFPHGHNSDHYSLIRDGRWKAIHNYGDRSWELYDLEADLSEEQNLAAERPEVLAPLAGKLQAALEAMDAQFSTDAETGRPVTLTPPGSLVPNP